MSYKKIFIEYYDHYLLEYIRIESICEGLLNRNGITLADILNTFKLDDNLAEKLWRDRISRLLTQSYNQKLEEKVGIIIKELKLIVNQDTQTSFAEIAIDRIEIHTRTRGVNFLSVAPTIASGSLKCIEDSYFNLFTKIQYTSYDLVVYCLLNYNERYPNLDLIQNLLGYYLIISNTDELTPEKVKEILIKDPSLSHFWNALLKQAQIIRKNEYMSSLVNSIYALCNDIRNKTISISDILHIKSQTEEKRAAFLHYIEIVIRLSEGNYDGSFSQILNSSIHEVEKIAEDVLLLNNFIDIVCKNITDYDALKDMYTKSIHGYEKMSLKSFVIPQEVACYLAIAQQCSFCFYSRVFTRYYLELQGVANSQTIIQICTAAYDNMIQELQSIFANFDACPLNKLQEIFKDKVNIEKEIDMIKRLIKPDNTKLIELGEILYYLAEKENYKTSCEAILNLSKILAFTDNFTLIACEDYLNVCLAHLDSITIRVFHSYSEIVKSQLSIGLSKDDYEVVAKIIKEISLSADLISFLLMMKETELDHMREGVNDYEEESFINTQIVFDLENLWIYIHDLQRVTDDYKEFVRMILEKKNDAKHKGVIGQFSSCKAQLVGIKELFIELNCKEEAKKKQIIEIYLKSRLRILDNEKHEYGIQLIYDKNPKIKLTLENLLELKDRASLILHTSESKEEEDESSTLAVFIEFINIINSVINTLIHLYNEGYPDSDIIVPDEDFHCENGDYSGINLYMSVLNNQLETWKNTLLSEYETNYWLAFLHGQQFWTLEKYLITRTSPQANKALNLLKYMGKATNALPPYKLKAGANIAKRIHILGKFLRKLPNANYQHEIEEKIGVLKKNLEVKLSQGPREVLLVENTNFIQSIISLYLNANYLFPRLDQIFYCRYETDFNDLTAFLYRCFKRPKELYILVNSEELTIENYTKFKALFDHLCFNHREFCDFRLGLIVSEKQSPLFDYFKYHEKLKITIVRSTQLLETEVIAEIVKAINPLALLVTSRIAGLGKTFFIKEMSSTCERQFISFPIAGDVNFADIGARLSELDLSRPSTIALQLSYVDKTSLLNKLLVDLTLFGMFYYSKDVFVVPEGSVIFIEVANTYNNALTRDLFYLNYLNQRHIEFMDLDKLVISTDIDDKLQYICSYLHLYKHGQINTHEVDDNTGDNKLVHPNHRVKEYLREFFIERQTDQANTNFIQLNIFINVLHWLLSKFTSCFYFKISEIQFQITEANANGLSILQAEYSTIRHTILEAFLLTTEEFTTKSIKSVRESQTVATSQLGPDQGEDEAPDEELIKQFECKLSWESSNHFNMILLEDLSVVFIYRDQQEVPSGIRKFIFIQENAMKLVGGPALAKMLRAESTSRITDYSSLTHIDLLKKLNTFSYNNLEFLYAESDYVMTPDNFLKMNLIYLRIKAGVPVVIMGETGCGKTSLIRFFAKRVLNDKLKVFSIHAGVTARAILERMNEYISIALALSYEDPKKKLWIFFDEFNTTDSIGLLCEILCQRTLLGNVLPDNMAFLAACNPYRLKAKPSSYQEDVGIKKVSKLHNEKTSRLVHIVKPLPDSVIEYVWDFGTLSNSDIREYVNNMLKNAHFTDLDLFTELICYSHSFFQQKEDTSSVSLRDVARLIILYKWFETTIRQRDSMRDDNPNSLYSMNRKYYELEIQNTENPQLTAGVLALCHCYYLRIASQDERDRFLLKLEEVSQGVLSKERIEFILANEQNDYLTRMELIEGIAINKALRENIFAIIPCVINKIPVFICGKPGCSKSLAIQLVFASLRGDKSEDPFFKTLPELIMVSFQGSDSCTSDGVLKTFEKAKKFLEIEKVLEESEDDNTAAKKRLPVVVFDEIGLAELSKYNPLKVLHSLLELEKRTVGFVGISNWRLDASKMNRALYLARPDPGENELIFTAMRICAALNSDDTRHEHLIKALAKSYFSLKKDLQGTVYSDLYGLRDFYHLIKQVSRSLAKTQAQTKEDIAAIAKQAIQRNFGGTINAAKTIGKFFTKEYQLELIYPYIPDTNVIDLVKENIKDKNARYLMLIGREDVTSYIVEKCLDKTLASRRTMVGSSLENDENKEDYGFRSLSDIILYLEKGLSVTLKSMDHIYSSLYDLFNQNFAVSGEKRFCRIALGALFNPRCFVHDDFHVIIFMDDDEDKLIKIDAPFLNRFEKHHLTLDAILSDEQRGIAASLEEWIETLTCIQYTQANCLRKNNIFPIYSTEALNLFALAHSELAIEDAVETCKRILIKTAPADLLILVKLSSLDEHQKTEISDIWRESHIQSFAETLMEMLQDRGSNKLLAFTYGTEMSTQTLVTQEDSPVIRRDITNFKSEQDLRKDLVEFFKSGEKFLYLVELDLSRDGKHILLIKYIYEKLEADFNLQNSKKICILVHMRRNIRYESAINLLEGWEMIMFDDIEHAECLITEELLKTSTKELIEQEFVKFKDIITRLTEKCIMNFEYKRKSNIDSNEDIKRHIDFIIEHIDKDDTLVNALKNCVIGMIDSPEPWMYTIFSDGDVVADSNKLRTAISCAIEKEYAKSFNVLLFILESGNSLESYFTDKFEEHGEILRDIWLKTFASISTSRVAIQNLNQNTRIYYECRFKFPFIVKEYSIINEIYLRGKVNTEDEEVLHSFFRELFEEKSIVKNHLEGLNEYEILQEYYLKDVIKQKLIDNLIESRFESTVYIFLQNLTPKTLEFSRKLLLLLDNEKLIILICRALDISCKLRQQDILPEFEEKMLENRAEEEKAESDQDEQEMEEEKAESDQDEQEMEEEGSPSWRELIAGIFDGIITEIYPAEVTVEALGGLETYHALIENFGNILYELAQEDVQCTNLQIVRFWVEFVGFINKTDIQPGKLIEFAKLAKQIDEHEPFLYSSEFKDKLILLINEYKDLYAAIQFKCLFYYQILGNCPDCIQDIAIDLEHTEIWRYSSAIVKILVDNLGIIDIIEDIKENAGNLKEFKIKKNQYLKSLEYALKTTGLKSRLALLISDYLSKYFAESNEDDVEFSLDYLTENYEWFEFFSEQFEEQHKKLANIKKLISITMIHDYISYYPIVIQNDPELSVKQYDIINYIDNYIVNSSIAPTLQLFCIKTIFRYDSANVAEQYNFLNTKRAAWAENLPAPQSEVKLDVFPYIKGETETYRNVVLYIDIILSSDPKYGILDQYIKDVSTAGPEISIVRKLVFGLAFLNKVFLIHLEGQMHPNIINWVDSKLELMNECFGHEFTQLIVSYIRNFSDDSFLHLKNTLKQTKIDRILCVCFIMTILFSYSKKVTPLTDIFFENGRITENLPNIFNNKFVFAAESHPMLEYLRMLSQNYETLRNPNQIGTYKCADDCDFIYVVRECGQCMEERNCPFCGKTIGGKEHKLHNRPGHRLLTHEDAKQYLTSKIKEYENQLAKGRNLHGISCPESAPRDLDSLSYKILNLILNSVMYSLKALDLLSFQGMKAILTVENDDFECFYSMNIKYQLKRIQTLIDIPDSHVFLYNCISRLPTVLNSNSYPVDTADNRDLFEIAISKGLVEPCSQSPVNSVVEYKRLLKAEFETDYTLKDYIEELKGSGEERYELIEYFRFKESPSLEKMANTLEIFKNKENLQLLEFYMKRKGDFEKLNHYYPIIDLTNSLLEKYNHRISREESRKTTMAEVVQEFPDVQPLFEEFLEAWEGADFVQVQYACKVLERIHFSWDSELIYFLVDNKETGGGMYMAGALMEFAKLQNTLLNEVSQIFTLKKNVEEAFIVDPLRYSIQSIRKDNLLTEPDNLALLIAMFSMNNSEYGKGSEIIYDFERIQSNIFKKITNKKFLEEEKLNLIQYQFELLSIQGEQSGLIIDIRKAMKQQQFSRNTAREIDYYFNSTASKDKEGYPIILREIYGSLNSILCFLKNSRNTQDCSISEFCSQLNSARISPLFKGKPPLCQVLLSNIIQLYESVEIKYFTYMENSIRPEFKDKEMAEQIKKMVQIVIKHCEKQNGYPSVDDFRIALMRLIMRCLTSDLNPEHPLRMYIIKPDFWEEDYDEKIDLIEEVIPYELLLSHSFAAYNAIKEILNPVKTKTESKPRSAKPKQQINMKQLIRSKPKINF